jgi:cellulose synthase/poly-beta-1,6-N-acetylglucosamine synthase-like glycosyltransferase
MITWIVILLYSFSLLYIFLFSMGQLHLAWIYTHRKKEAEVDSAGSDFMPSVTIQLPVYNEIYVVDRLLDAISLIRYPYDKLEIQILDDSTDETSQLLERKTAELQSKGLDVKLIHRVNRDGYKAGALANGFQLSKGDFIAIFDADFIPQPDFLEKTIPHFTNPQIGAVQTRWGHVNKDYSLLTQLQAFGLDAHFSIEQVARNSAGSFINFNGTCGVWRRDCIKNAGGWSADTLTEDLDLSYRAQLNGWKFKYLESVDTPGELPVIMPAVKTQQYRWNKGGAQTARKVFPRVMRSDLPGINKVHAFLHLFNSSVFVFLLIAAILSVPILYIKHRLPGIEWLFNLGIFFLLGFLSITIFYWIATKRFYSEKPHKTFWTLFPRFLVVSMGMSLHNGIAVMEGWMGKKTPFIRTPKFNVVVKSDSWKGNIYAISQVGPLVILEGILCLYFIFGTALGILLKDPGLIFFHVMLAAGFGAVFIYSVKPAIHA